ncbi:MAG: prepilin-type N-terminal cleavage/methylation domain-containing protein [Acidobacteriota bacterium]
MTSTPIRPLPRPAGFTLTEMLVSMLVLGQVVTAIFVLLNSMSSLARVQTSVAELQQGQRVAQNVLTESIRLAGIGGMPLTVREGNPALLPRTGIFPDGIAIEHVNNVADNTLIGNPGPGWTEPAMDQVLTGSDILTTRGVFDAPVYYLSPQPEIGVGAAATGGLELVDAGGGEFNLTGQTLQLMGTINGQVEQDLQPLADALNLGRSRAMIVRDLMNPGAYAILEYTGPFPAVVNNCAGVQCMTLNLSFSDQGRSVNYGELMDGSILAGNTVAGRMVRTSGPLFDGRTVVAFPRRIGAIGLLQEFRYFLRVNADPLREEQLDVQTLNVGDPPTMPAPILARAEALPGTNLVVDRIDIADNLFDFQVAFGIDTNLKCPPACTEPERELAGRILEGTDAAARGTDEILFNSPLDANPPAGGLATWADPDVDYHFLRITAVVHTGRPEPNHLGHNFGLVEDVDRSVAFDIAGDTYDYNAALGQYRRRLVSTTIDLRNVR